MLYFALWSFFFHPNGFRFGGFILVSLKAMLMSVVKDGFFVVQVTVSYVLLSGRAESSYLITVEFRSLLP